MYTLPFAQGYIHYKTTDISRNVRADTFGDGYTLNIAAILSG